MDARLLEKYYTLEFENTFFHEIINVTKEFITNEIKFQKIQKIIQRYQNAKKQRDQNKQRETES